MAEQKRKDSKNHVLKEGEYERANGSFEYRWRDYRGERHSVYAKTLEELRGKERDITRGTLDGLDISKSNLTVDDLFNMWLELKRGLKDSTRQVYISLYRANIQKELGGLKIVTLKKSIIKSFYNKLVDEKQLKPGTLRGVQKMLHQLLDIAVEDEIIRVNPANGALRDILRSADDSGQDTKILTVPQQRRFEEFISSSKKCRQWYGILMVLLWTGLRLGECIALCWSDIDWEKGIIHISRSLSFCKKDGEHFETRIFTPKTKAGRRTIPLLPIVRRALLFEKKRQADLGIITKGEIDGISDFVFLGDNGMPYKNTYVYFALKTIVKNCNKESLRIAENTESEPVLLPNISPHWLRHTFTTRMCEAGVNPKAMQSILGHTDISTTLNIYTEATEDLKSSELIRFSDFFKDDIAK